MNLFFRVAGVVATLLLFLGAGVLIGAKRPDTTQPTQTIRFHPLANKRAFDSKTGLTCAMDVPAGITLDDGTVSCAELATR